MKFLGHDSLTGKTLLAAAGLWASASTVAAELTVNISNFGSEVGVVNVTVYDNPDDWLGSNSVTTRALRISEVISDGVVTTVFTVEPGEYALSVHHDDNDNGKMDTNFIGIPKEPTGLSNGAVPKFGPPKYKDAVFTVGEDGAEMGIKLLD